MGGSSHRIEILLVGVVLLLGAAFAAGTSLLPQRETALFEVRLDIGQATVPPVPALQLPALPNTALVDNWHAQFAAVGTGNLAVAAAVATLAIGGFTGVQRGWADRLRRAMPLLVARSRVFLSSAVLRLASAGSTLRRWGGARRAQRSVGHAPVRVAPFIVDRPSLPLPEPAPAVPITTREPEEVIGPAPTATGREWAPDELAHAAGALFEQWRTARELRSQLAALDVDAEHRRVRLLLDADPADGAVLLALPEHLLATAPGWDARWRGGALELTAPPEPAAASHGPLLAPLLRHGRRKQYRRYLSLERGANTANQLLVCGAAANEVLHNCLTSLLFTHPPETLALLVLDGNGAAPLYAAAPHAIRAPGSPRATLAALDRAVRRGSPRDRLRHLLVAVIDPDAATLADLNALVARMRAVPPLPLTLVLAQQQPLAAGREVYAVLPTLLTAGRAGDAPPLAGQRWPRSGHGRLVTDGVILEGVPLQRTESDVCAVLALLGQPPEALPPTLLDFIEVRTPAEEQTMSWIAPPLPFGADELAARLAQALEHEPLTPAETPTGIAVPEAVEPPGAGDMAPAELEALVARLLVEPSIVAATPPGLTKKRLSTLLPSGQRSNAAGLIEWFDRAGVLEPPRDETLRWREPRRLCDTEPGSIIARLQATPGPR